MIDYFSVQDKIIQQLILKTDNGSIEWEYNGKTDGANAFDICDYYTTKYTQECNADLLIDDSGNTLLTITANNTILISDGRLVDRLRRVVEDRADYTEYTNGLKEMLNTIESK
jgi:hypothetical protein